MTGCGWGLFPDGQKRTTAQLMRQGFSLSQEIDWEFGIFFLRLSSGLWLLGGSPSPMPNGRRDVCRREWSDFLPIAARRLLLPAQEEAGGPEPGRHKNCHLCPPALAGHRMIRKAEEGNCTMARVGIAIGRVRG